MIQGERFLRADEILQQLLGLPESEQSEYLARSCDDDRALHVLVERLLIQAMADDTRLRPGAAFEMLGVETQDFAPDPVSAFAPGDRVGAFQLVRCLGRGGMATVYLAARVDGQFEQNVALKFLNRAGESIARFEQERQILASFDHPNIARLLDGGVTDQGVPYVAMEYVEGESLLEYCDREQLSIERRLRIFNLIIDAVHEAHRKLIVHRDIKSANIIVTADGVPKLLDFGIAKLLDTDALPHAAPATRVLAPMTPEYASPEQIRGEPMTVATDIYQLGYLLYVLLTDQSPYAIAPNDIAALVDAITRRDPIAPSRRVADVDIASSPDGGTPWQLRNTTQARLRNDLRGDLDRVVLKALHKDPDRRYGSVAEFAKDIENVLTHRPISARPDSAGYRTQKFVQRHTFAVGATSAVILAIVIGTSLFTYGLSQAKQQAELEAAKATEVASFMRELFRSANPEVTAGATLTAREVLDKGLVQLQDRLDINPVVRADLLHTMGYAYLELGVLDTAEQVLQESLDLRQAVAGTENEDYVTTLYVMADLYRVQGRYAQAEALARQVYESSRRILGNEAQQTQRALRLLGTAIFRQSRFKEAEEMQRKLLTLTRRTLGEQHPDVVDALKNASISVYMQGRIEEALELLEQAFQLGMNVLGEKHPTTLKMLNNIALYYEGLGRLRESTEVYERVITLRIETLGEEHPHTLRTKMSLARLFRLLGDNEVAIPKLEHVVAVQTRTLGAEHPDTLWTQQELALGYAALGRSQEAESMLQTLLEQRTRLFGEGHHLSVWSRYQLGSVLRQNKKYRSAERQLQTAVDLNRAAGGGVESAYYLLELGLVYRDDNQLERAETILQEARQITVADQIPDLHGALLHAWGETLRLRGRLDEAEPSLLEGLEIMSSIFGKEHDLTREVAGSLSQLYAARGQTTETQYYSQMAGADEHP